MGRINKQQMGPLYHLRRFQDTIQVSSPSFVSSDKSESIFLPVTARRDCGTSPETGSGKGTRSGNSRFLFPVISCSKKEQKVTPSNRSFFAKSIHKETTIQDGDSQFSTTIGLSFLFLFRNLYCGYLLECLIEVNETSAHQSFYSEIRRLILELNLWVRYLVPRLQLSIQQHFSVYLRELCIFNLTKRKIVIFHRTTTK